MSTPSPWIIEQMRSQFEANPLSVDPSWRHFFHAHQTSSPHPSPLVPSSPADPHPSPIFDSAPPSPQPEDDIVAAQVSFADPVPPLDQMNSESVTRSDLPPAPPAVIRPATSPYARLHATPSSPKVATEETHDTTHTLRGPARATAKNMDDSLQVPTATSQRQMPAKLLIENRALLNTHLARTVGGKVSFTHIISYAIVEALTEMPGMNVRYSVENNKPSITQLAHVGLGIAVDLPREDGTRSLVVPVIRDADTLTFPQFVQANLALVKRAREGLLTAADFNGTTVTVTNPGTLGTTTSVPRLMNGQGLIIGIGATDYPAEFAGVSPQRLARMGVGKTMFMSSTYDHRVIQGAASGELLRVISRKLMGLDGFYERIFDAYHVPLQPYVWAADHEYDPEREKGKPARITEIIHAFRSRGHLAADTDPLAYRVRRHPDLDITHYGLSVWDLDRDFPTGGFGGTRHMTLRDILLQLRDTYTRSIGIEYMHIQDPEQRRWVQEQVELPYTPLSKEETLHVLKTLIHAEAFEEFLQTKFVGQKRFSLEGGESLIPLLDAICGHAARTGTHEVAIGMAHRGRLNVLANVAGKSHAQIFSEFEGNQDPSTVQGSGDVKYHLGTEGIYTLEDGLATKISLAANPSHLEAANGVLEGIVRAKLDRLSDPSLPVVPVLIHGDAAFIGQGVVQETLNMSQLDGYHTGGTIHIIVNNQIGFTTGPTSGRSTRYPTDLAKGLQVPILHVNADDPEAVVRVGLFASAYRDLFHKDVIIDLVCYRRRGHNEGDDPSMTQPVMYALIQSMPSTREYFTENLVGRGLLTTEEARASYEAFDAELTAILEDTRSQGWKPEEKTSDATSLWGQVESQKPGQGMMIGWSSATDRLTIERVGQAHITFPGDFTPHPKVVQLAQRREEMSRGLRPIDWGFAELLAFGSLLMEGTPVRVSGQDARRATFVQRHAVMHDHTNGREFTPLHFLTEDQASFDIFDSPLSEYAVLAFEYGYSVERPDALVVWEAQFGDFANGAQTVIDEFVCSAEQKWQQRSSVVLLLPHGFEGQGPDHSSARIERYLSLAAEDNIWIVQPSTPANHFHMLREQAYRRPRKPLVAFTPKQLLRLPAAVSSVEDLTQGQFQPIIDEVDPVIRGGDVSKIVLCSGRIYYELAERRRKLADEHTAIIRVEQLYPQPTGELESLISRWPDAELLWVQDEPENQGPWPFFALTVFSQLDRKVSVVSRPASATTATGRPSQHKAQAEEILQRTFTA